MARPSKHTINIPAADGVAQDKFVPADISFAITDDDAEVLLRGLNSRSAMTAAAETLRIVRRVAAYRADIVARYMDDVVAGKTDIDDGLLAALTRIASKYVDADRSDYAKLTNKKNESETESADSVDDAAVAPASVPAPVLADVQADNGSILDDDFR